jgi:hypothetical protein
MQLAAFWLLVFCVLAGGGLGIWAGKWLYFLCPLKGNAAYVFGCFIVCPAACIAIVLSFAMPVVYFLAGIGRKR